MEIINAFGGLSLMSPTLAELQCMPMPTLEGPSILCIRKKKPYIGGSYDIFPPLSKGGERILWYMGKKYFRVSSHVSKPNNHRVNFWSGSHITYRLPSRQTTSMEVIECLVDSRNGDPTFVGRLFISLDEIRSSTSSIPNFIHSDGVRKSIQNEQFYTTTSILCYLQNVQDVVDCFFIWTSYELWARHIPRGMDSKAFYCESLVQLKHLLQCGQNYPSNLPQSLCNND
jgi:hypothetical protein